MTVFGWRLEKRTNLAVSMMVAVILSLSVAIPGIAAAQDDAPQFEGTLKISGIPDQDVAVLNRQFGTVADYLAETTGIDFEYVPMVDYAALVTAFERGDVDLAWFGGLTGVQARDRDPSAQAIAQRPRDEEFTSVFIVQSDLDVEELSDLEGLSFSFGSESSTSGHLMPRFFLQESGIDPESDFRSEPIYSGSHDATIELVESGAAQAGALNSAVWEARVEAGEVDLDKVKVFYTSPPYYDYNWTIRGDVDERLGEGAAQAIQDALLALDPADPDQKAILDLFQAEGFIETSNENYDAIRDVAEELGIIR